MKTPAIGVLETGQQHRDCSEQALTENGSSLINERCGLADAGSLQVAHCAIMDGYRTKRRMGDPVCPSQIMSDFSR